jgi:putative phosphonate catabolism associated alcohol dehydrogenase
MRTSKLAIFHGPGQPLSLETVAIPALRSGEILVRNEYTTLCRSDLNTYSGKRKEKVPTILGHEIIGTIEEFGPGAPGKDCRGSELRRGNRVTWAIYASNPDSALSRVGIPQKGDGVFKYGHEQVLPNQTLHGGLAQYCILRPHTPVIRINALIPLSVMALINCAVATVSGALRIAGTVKDCNMVIAGAGMLGVVACAMSRCLAARRIIAVDIDDARLATAKKFGADLTLNARTMDRKFAECVAELIPGEGVTVALDFSGIPETMEALISVLSVGGTAVLVGATFPQRALEINAEQLIRRVLTIKGLHNYNAEDLVTAVEFMEQNHDRLPFSKLVCDQFDLDSVDEAFQFGMDPAVYRVGVRIGQGNKE